MPPCTLDIRMPPYAPRVDWARAILVMAALASLPGSARSQSPPPTEPPRGTIRTKVDGVWLEGTPLSWHGEEFELLCRDGSLRSFAADAATQTTKVSDTFASYSAGDMRAALRREFGNGYEVSGTGHYLVVHPAGQRDYWAERFEQLYRSFVHYFSVRGLKVQRPRFPLVAIVVPREQDMHAYAAREGTRIGRGVLGYYSSRSNRVILYDQSGGKASKKDWADNSDTIIHEATHQSAFNTGVHRRWPQPPAWVVEGLGTMFEAPGVWNSENHRNREDRLNRGRLATFKKIATQVNGPVLADMIASDRQYRANPGAAYAIGWALTFYLVETQPGKYRDYLKRTTAHTKREATSDQRLADFKAVFGDDFAMFNARFQRFMADQR
jgi:hypothetical protein